MIKESQAREFKRDLMGTLHRDSGRVSEYTVSCRMVISLEEAREFLRACVRYGFMRKVPSGYEF